MTEVVEAEVKTAREAAVAEFWIPEDPPVLPLTEWCVSEVEKACRDMAANLGVHGWLNSAGSLAAAPFLDGDWDIGVDLDGRPIAELLSEALESHVCYAFDESKRHIDPLVQPAVLARLAEIEAVVAKYRALCRTPSPLKREE